MKTIALLFASTLFYGVFHYLLVKSIRNSDLAQSLAYSQRKSTFEVTPRRVALKVCACIQIICAFLMGLLVVHDVTSPPKNTWEIRVQVSLLMLPVRGSASDYTLRAVVLTTGFWIFHFLSDLRRFLFWSGRIQSSAKPGNSFLAANTKSVQFLKLVSTHICPLAASWAFISWRSAQFYGNPDGEGLGFTDLMIGLLLCCLLPGLLDNTRWIVYAVDPDSKGSWEGAFMDIAVAMNRVVCHVLIWPFLLLIYYRHEHGGIQDPAIEVPNFSAIATALYSLPLRCSVGTIAFCGAGVYALYYDLLAFKRTMFSYRKKTDTSSQFAPPPPPPKEKKVKREEEDATPPSTNDKPSLSHRGGSTKKDESWKTSLREEVEDGGEEGEDLSRFKERDPSEDDNRLPESLLKLATTADDLNWLRAQKRISRHLKEEARIERERLAREGKDKEENDEDDEYSQLLRKKDD